MSLLSPPPIPLFRITLFYGPEPLEGASDTMQCVFNVKKRSWKGGVQVGIGVQQADIRRLTECLDFQSWLERSLHDVPDHEQEDYLNTGYDLFIQFICFYKLKIYIQEGIRQKNAKVSGVEFKAETDELVRREANQIKAQIIAELDIHEFEATS